MSARATQLRPGFPTAGELSARLASRILSLVTQILPNGRRQGHEWRVGGVHGDTGLSMTVCLTGEKAGVWHDFSTGEAGDAFDLVAAVLYRGDRKATYAWCMDWLGESGGRAAPATQKAYTPEIDTTKVEHELAKRRASALRLWLQAEPSLSGTPAAAYLQARGIDLARLGRQPRALRFHPACYCADLDERLPAMLGAITNFDGETRAVHRTWLAQRGGVWGKALQKGGKKSLGSVRGGTIRLRRGASNKPLRDAPQGDSVVIGEGIETCLSVAFACPDLRVLCGVSRDNMASIVLPPTIERVILLADNDGENPGAAAGLQRVINHFARTVPDVRLARAPIGKDFNDCLTLCR